MGRPKLALPLGDSMMVQHVIDAAAQSSVDEVIVVVGAAADQLTPSLLLPRRARLVVNENFEAGLSSSLVVGLRSCSAASSGAVILLGDQPTMSSRLIDHVLGSWRQGSRPVARANYKGIPGHPVVIARSVWVRVEDVVGDRGASAFLEAHPDLVEKVVIEEVAPPDLDSPEDYQALLSGWRTPDVD